MNKTGYLLLLFFCLTGLWACEDSGNGSAQNGNDTEGHSGTEVDSGMVPRLTQQIIDHPGDAGLYARRARAYEAQGQLEPAVRDMVTAVELDTSNTRYLRYLGDLYMKRPFYEGAIQAYEGVVLYNPKDTQTLLDLGKLYFTVKSRDQSFAKLNAVLRLDPANATAFYYRGYNYREMGFTKDAVSNFLRAVEYDPENAEAYLQLGILHEETDKKQALQYYNTALRLEPENIPALYARGLFYQHADSLARATEDYGKILHINPGHREANYNLGYVYYLENNCDKAIEHFSNAIAADGNYEEAYYGRGLCLQKQGKSAAAQRDLARADELREAKEELRQKQQKKKE